MGFSRQEYWSELPCPLPGDLPHPGIEPASLCLLHWQAGSLPLSHLGSPGSSVVPLNSTPVQSGLTRAGYPCHRGRGFSDQSVHRLCSKSPGRFPARGLSSPWDTLPAHGLPQACPNLKKHHSQPTRERFSLQGALLGSHVHAPGWSSLNCWGPRWREQISQDGSGQALLPHVL